MAKGLDKGCCLGKREQLREQGKRWLHGGMVALVRPESSAEA